MSSKCRSEENLASKSAEVSDVGGGKKAESTKNYRGRWRCIVIAVVERGSACGSKRQMPCASHSMRFRNKRHISKREHHFLQNTVVWHKEDESQQTIEMIQ